MTDVFAKCFKKIAVQVCTKYIIQHIMCVDLMSWIIRSCLILQPMIFMFPFLNFSHWLVFIICRLKINHDFHEFILESNTVANSSLHTGGLRQANGPMWRTDRGSLCPHSNIWWFSRFVADRGGKIKIYRIFTLFIFRFREVIRVFLWFPVVE